MKKRLILLAAIALLLGMVGCAGKAAEETTETTQPPPANLTGSLEDILADLYEAAELEESFAEFVETGLMTVPIEADQCEYYFGTSVPFVEAIASEPQMSTSAYSLCLLRMDADADFEAIKQSIRDNVDPMRWVCVGVDPANIVVDHIGDVVVLIMSDQAKDELHAAFQSLAG